MRVAEIMTSPVVGIEPTASISEAASLMLSNRISGLPVMDSDKHVVGVVTEGDFLRRGELGTIRKRPRWLEFFTSAGREAEEYVQTHGRRVRDVMSPSPVTISPHASVEELVDLMLSHKIKRVPVVENDLLVGIVARSDLMRTMLHALPGTTPAVNDDERLRQAILTEMGKWEWSVAIRVNVDHGVAELSGIILDERARDAAHVAAENVPGVKKVIDQLTYVEPISGMYILPETDRTK